MLTGTVTEQEGKQEVAPAALDVPVGQGVGAAGHVLVALL